MLPIGGGQFLIYEDEEPTPTVVSDGIPDTFTLGRVGKKRRHRVEV